MEDSAILRSFFQFHILVAERKAIKPTNLFVGLIFHRVSFQITVSNNSIRILKIKKS
jgi:hypothetical protein